VLRVSANCQLLIAICCFFSGKVLGFPGQLLIAICSLLSR